MQAAAAPTDAQLGTAKDETAPPIDSRADHTARGSPSSSDSSRRSPAEYVSSERRLTSAGRREVASVPTPRFTSPSPRGKIQPYPDSSSSAAPRSSKWEEIHGSSARPDFT